MVQKGKINVKERYSDGEVDLSMSDLDEVPVKEIAALKKTTSLDLSNNRLTYLPSNFTILTNLTKLDLSKNEITELPEDFGNLSKLKYLDLYKNNLERLPLSFGQLNALKFLDLKDNPLIPTIAKVAGPCVDTKGCQQCARDVVNFYRRLKDEVDTEVEMRKNARQKQLEINQKKKQDEKKKQKKDKQNKLKKDSEQNGIKNTPESSKKQSKKEQKINKNAQYSDPGPDKVLIICLGISFLIALYTCTIYYPAVQPYINSYNYYYHLFLDKLPPSVSFYIDAAVKSFFLLMKTALLTFAKYTSYLSDNETLQGIILTIKNSTSHIVQRIFGKIE